MALLAGAALVFNYAPHPILGNAEREYDLPEVKEEKDV